MNAGTCQYVGERCHETLPFTGFAVWILIVIGLALIATSLIMWRHRED